MNLENRLFAVNKPKGITSFNLLRKIKPRLQNGMKIGHGGTLDPHASGVMIIGTGNATKLLNNSLTQTDKEYIAHIKLGYISETFDCEGKIIEFDTQKKIWYFDIEEALQKNFQGEIMQTPPKFSAIHIDGQRAYNLARKGNQ